MGGFIPSSPFLPCSSPNQGITTIPHFVISIPSSFLVLSIGIMRVIIVSICMEIVKAVNLGKTNGSYGSGFRVRSGN
jgi:hypothetical protein